MDEKYKRSINMENEKVGEELRDALLEVQRNLADFRDGTVDGAALEELKYMVVDTVLEKWGLQRNEMRIDNLEFRTCNEDLTSASPHTTAEIVKWDPISDDRYGPSVKEVCYTLMYWEKDKEGCCIRFVGNRPFEVEDVEWDKMWSLAREGQKFLDKKFSDEEE